ncbi:hypothetical protein MHK_006488 [Candidatus Magnetomorum sp. HK-1]|nr:hypothetical protein MHK_006488 [Candidatus Magnetomorum sp. HK-1]
MKQIKRIILFINDQQVITEISPEFYHDFISHKEGGQLNHFKGKRVRLAEIHLESISEGTSSIVNAEFRYLFVAEDGYLDTKLFEEFIQAGIDAVQKNMANDPSGDYRKRFFWKPTNDEFKTLMSLALKKDIPASCKVMNSHTLPIDNSDPIINGIRKMLAAFPGIRVVGCNRSLHFWTITFDVINLYGLISLLFLREGLKHEIAVSQSLTLASPDDDMRYVFSCTSITDVKKVSVWMIYIYQKRLQYKDMSSQSSCSCSHH